MKILGTNKKGFIVEIGIREIANLQGYDSEYDGGFKKPEVGTSINIDYLYHRILEVQRLTSRDKFNDAINEARHILTALINAKQLYKDVVTESNELDKTDGGGIHE